MQSVIAEHFDSHMDAEVFEQTLEDITGVDMTPWFEAQVLQPGFSTWVLDSTSHESGSAASTLFLQQKLRACENYHMAEPLDVTVWDENWDRYDTQISANGQFDEITIEHPGIDSPAYIALNANGKLNQGRLDFMYTITEPEGIQNLPWVEMRVGCDAMPESDSALVRIEHHWAAPDQSPVEPYVDQLSNTHFWVVDGIWPDGTLLDARIQYYGNTPDGLDYDLYGDTEANGFLAWRPDASSPWQECTAYEWQPGSLTNGAGLFRVSDLKKGQYAFAKGDVSSNVTEVEITRLTLWPNPTSETLNISSTAGISAFQIFNAKGQQVANVSNTNASNALTIDVSRWAKGWYVFEDVRGDSQRFMVE
jgi:hypothetical protein